MTPNEDNQNHIKLVNDYDINRDEASMTTARFRHLYILSSNTHCNEFNWIKIMEK